MESKRRGSFHNLVFFGAGDETQGLDLEENGNGEDLWLGYILPQLE